MKPLTLRTRIFLASALVAVLSLAAALQYVTARAGEQAEAELQRGLDEAARLVARRHGTRADDLLLLARLVADLPKLKAALATGDAPTIAPVADDYRERVHAASLAVADPRGVVLTVVGAPLDVPAPVVHDALGGRRALTALPSGGALRSVVAVPVVVGPDPPELLGALLFAFLVDDAFAADVAAGTGSDVAFVLGDTVYGASRADARAAAVAAVVSHGGAAPVELGGEDHAARAQPLSDGSVAVVLRSRAERLRLLRTVRDGVLWAGALGVLTAVVLGWAVARGVTGPLSQLAGAMREMTATGDLERKIRLDHGDAETRVLASAFDSLTDALARFQREAAHRERLSALGRLSAVVAHEVRNPLMIVKANVSTLRAPQASAEDVAEAAAEIERQVARLNRVVGDVLDFARPVRIDAAPTDVNAVCREAAAAVTASASAAPLALELDPAAPRVVTDAERLRSVLVNLLANAREVASSVELRTAALDGGAVEMQVRDDGPGIAPEHLPHVWEPFFTTRRTGSGLGLAIVRNVTDALGASVRIDSGPAGTIVRLELPPQAPAVRT